MQYSLEQFDPDRLEGPDRPSPGSYHVEVLEVEPEDPKTGALWTDWEVLAGDVPGQEGKIHREYISNTPASVGRIMQLAVAIGLTTVEDLKRHKAAGTMPDIDWTKAVGRQLCTKLVSESYQGKQRVRANFNIWSVDDPRAKGIPLNQAKLSELRRRLAGEYDDPFGQPPNEKPDSDLF